MTTADDNDPSLVQLSTSNFPERERLTIWRDVCSRTLLRLDMEPLSEGFSCAANIRLLPGLAAGFLTTTPNHLSRTPQLLDDGNDDLIFVITTRGGFSLSEHGREAEVGAGEALLFSSREPSDIFVREQASFVILTIPRAVLAPRIVDLDQALASVVHADMPALRLLHGYITQTHEEMARFPAELLDATVSHIHDLIALTVGATRDDTHLALGRGARAARLREIKADIIRHLGRADLSLVAVAARQQASPSYIRKLFEAEDDSFTAFVLRHRIDRAHRMLIDPNCADLAISAIAYAAGFGDLSYFNRVIRRKYGMTPTDIRFEALRQR
jgi:AraC-like DNA-binding protein